MRQISRLGFSLIEAAIVLGIIGLVIGGIWVAAARVSEIQKQNQFSSDVILMMENLRKLYHGMPFTDGGPDYTAEGIAAGIFPASLVVGGRTLTPWGHQVFLRGELNRVFQFVVNTETCIKLTSQLLGKTVFRVQAFGARLDEWPITLDPVPSAPVNNNVYELAATPNMNNIYARCEGGSAVFSLRPFD